MPAHIILHEAHALALHRRHENGERLAGAAVCVERCERRVHGVEILPVNLGDLKPERPHLVVHGRGVHYVFRRAVDLQAVQVDDDTQVVELVVRREEKCRHVR